MKSLCRRGVSFFISLALLLGMLPAYAIEVEQTTDSPLVLTTDEPNEASGSEETATLDDVTPESSGYQTEQTADSKFSLTTDKGTYYFASAASAFAAGDDDNLSGDMTLTVLQSNTEETAYSYTSQKYFSKAANLKLDLKDCSLFLKSDSDSTIPFSLGAETVTISGNGRDVGTLTLINGTLYDNTITEIKNASIIGKYTSGMGENPYLIGKTKTMVSISSARLAVETEGENEGYALYLRTPTKKGTSTISNSLIENKKGNAIYACGGRALTLEIESSELEAGKSAVCAMLRAKDMQILSKDSNYTAEDKIFFSNETSSNILITVDGGTFTGDLFGGETNSLSAVVKNGRFSADVSLIPNVTTENTDKTQNATDQYWEFALKGSVNVAVKKTGFDDAADIENDSVVFPGDELVFKIKLLPDMYISGLTITDESGQPLEGTTADVSQLEYSADRLSASYGMTVPDVSFTITFEVSVDQTLTEDVVEIGTVGYTSLSAALASISDGCEVTLLKDVEYPTQMTLTNKNFTLNLNGHTLTMNYDSPTEYGIVLRDSDLAVYDGSENGGGAISFSSKSMGIDVTGITKGSVFTLTNGELRNIGTTDGDADALSTINSGKDAPNASKIIINGGTIIGTVSLPTLSKGYLELNGGTIYASGRSAAAVGVGNNCSFKMTAGEIYSKNAAESGSGAVSLTIGEESVVEISGGKIESANGAAIAIINGVNDGSISISGTAELLSTDAAALSVGCSILENNLKLKLAGDAKYTGATYAISIEESEAKNGYYKSLPHIEISGGQFACGDDYILISDTSSVVFSDNNHVLDTKEHSSESAFLSLVTKDVLGGTYYPNEGTQLSPIPYTYQDFEGNRDGSGQGLDDLLEQAELIHTAGNDDSKYATETWNAFERAYEMALRVRANQNANQDEIDYRSRSLSASLRTLDSVQSLDIDSLQNGTYKIQVEIWKYNLSSHSMSNRAVDSTAYVIKDNNEWKICLSFKPIYVNGVWGHLEDFYIYDGDSLSDGALKQKGDAYGNDMSVKSEATYIEWYKGGSSDLRESAPDGVATGKGTDYCYPGLVEMTLPYYGVGDEKCYYWVGMNVDAMGGYATAILRLSWSTLEAVGELEDTLSLSKGSVGLSLYEGAKRTDTVTAKVLTATGDSTGWAITWASSDTSVATVAEDGTITAVGVGAATVTVTAAKDGAEPLTAEIAVRVTDQAPMAAGTTVTDSAAAVSLSGGTLVGVNDQITVTENKVAVDATTANSGVTSAELTIAPDAAAALAAEGKSVAIATDAGTLTLDKDAMSAAANSGQTVKLTLKNVSVPTLENVDTSKITAAYEVTAYYGETACTDLGGELTVTVPWTKTTGYVYEVANSKIQETNPMIVSSEAGTASWTTDHASTWALSPNGSLDTVEIKKTTENTYSVPLVIKQADAPSKDSMANDAVAGWAIAEVDDDGVTYTLFLQARVGSEGLSSGESLRGHLLRMWYYEPDDSERDNPIEVSYVKYYKDEGMDGTTGTFPRQVSIYQEGDPRKQFYVMVSVDAMGESNYQDAIVKLDWNKALADGGDKAESKFVDTAPASKVTASEKTVDSGSSVSRSKLQDWTDDDYTLLVQGEDDNLTASFDTDALESIYGKTEDSVKFVLEERKTSKLSDAQKAVVGDRPAFELKITSKDDTVTEIAKGKVEVTLPYDLKKNEDKGGLIVYLVNEDGSTQKIKCSYSSKNDQVTFDTTRFGVFAIIYDEDLLWTNPFTDVKESDWFFEAVKYAAQNGLFSGTTETTFSPNGTMTRGMLVTVLYRLAGSPEVSGTNSFTDVADSDYYANAILWATQNGVVSGYGDGLFGPNDSVSREQMAAILYNYAKAEGYDVSVVKGLDGYTDSSAVSSYAVRAMQWAVANGIISGTSDTTLSPKSGATRAQVATIHMRFDEQIVTPAGETTAK